MAFKRIKRFWKFVKAVGQVAKQLDGFLEGAETAMHTMKIQPEVWETDSFVIAQMEIPEIKKKDIKIEPMDTGIVVNVKRGTVNVQKYIPLPNYADTKNPKFTYENNVLEVKMPKNELQIK